jgi:DNA-binding transcriptional MerR regulator
MHQRKIPASAIEDLHRVLGEAAERRPKEFSKKEAVRLLLPEIRAMQMNGYSIAEIAQVLSEKGVATTAASLRTVLSSLRSAAESRLSHRSLREVKQGAARANATAPLRDVAPKPSGQRSGGHASTPPALARSESAPKLAQGAASSAPAAETSKRSPTSTSPERVARPGTFIPREDTDEI